MPATSANLGPGFDSLGLALSLYDDIEAGSTDGGLSIAISGEGEALADAGEQHLVVRAMRAGFAAGAGARAGCMSKVGPGRFSAGDSVVSGAVGGGAGVATETYLTLVSRQISKTSLSFS